MKNILVSGGAGFIGSHLVDRLIEMGKNVIIIDNLSTGLKENINKSAIFYKRDIRALNLKQIFQNHEIDTVFHFAAQIDVRKSLNEIEYEIDVNIKGSVNLIVNAAKYGVQEFYFTSTGGALYGDNNVLPATEETEVMPDSPYAIDKFTIEKYLESFKRLYGFKIFIFRLANVYGPRQNSQSEAGVIGIFSTRMLKNKKILVYGDGKQTRDFVYVKDVIDAMMTIYNKKVEGIFNVGTTEETDVLTLFEILKEELDYKREPIFLEMRPGELLRSALAYNKIKKAVGWKPKTSIEAGLKKTAKWYKENFR